MNGASTSLLAATIALLLVAPVLRTTSAQSTVPIPQGTVEVLVYEDSIFDRAEPEQPDSFEGAARFRVFVKRGRYVHELQSVENRRFTGNVPVGYYELFLKSPDGRHLNYKRAGFFVTSDKKARIAFSGIEGENEVCDNNFGFVALPSDGMSRTNYPPVRYESILIDSPGTMVVKYCKKSRGKTGNAFENALISYKNLLVEARRAAYNKRRNSLEVSGDVAIRIDGVKESCVRKSDASKVVIELTSVKSFECDDIKRVLVERPAGRLLLGSTRLKRLAIAEANQPHFIQRDDVGTRNRVMAVSDLRFATLPVGQPDSRTPVRPLPRQARLPTQ